MKQLGRAGDIAGREAGSSEVVGPGLQTRPILRS
jgi:hypothetical protein